MLRGAPDVISASPSGLGSDHIRTPQTVNALPGSRPQVNNAIHTIAVIRAKHQPETRAYLDRRTSEGKTKREALRALKRHLSRDLFKRLADLPLTS